MTLERQLQWSLYLALVLVTILASLPESSPWWHFAIGYAILSGACSWLARCLVRLAELRR